MENNNILIWKNTSGIEGFEDKLKFTKQKDHAEIVILGSKPIYLDEFCNLKGIFRAGIGKDNVPLVEAKKKNILVRFPSEKTKNIIFEETANFTCALILKMLFIKTGSVSPWRKESRRALKSKRLLVIGLGNIGKRVYSKMENFMDVDSFDIIHNKVRELNKKITLADIVTIHIPKTESNESFFDSHRLSLMKNNSILINTSRAILVDEDALYDELISARILAASDVFWSEPYHGKMLEISDNIFFKTPHVASNCLEYKSGCRKDLDNMIAELSTN